VVEKVIGRGDIVKHLLHLLFLGAVLIVVRSDYFCHRGAKVTRKSVNLSLEYG